MRQQTGEPKRDSPRARGRGGVAGARPVRVRLDRGPLVPAPVALRLDGSQRSAVEHRGGHLLLLGGPGTGRTTTLAEIVLARLSDQVAPVPAEAVLVLAHDRRAAGEMADRLGRRLAGHPVPVVATFHSLALVLLARAGDAGAPGERPRLLTASEQEARVRELLVHAVAEGRINWPQDLAGALGTRGIAAEVRLLMSRARSLGLDGRRLAAIGRRDGVPAWAALGPFLEEYLDTLGFEGTLDYAELIHRAASLVRDPRSRSRWAPAWRLVVVDEAQDADPAQMALLRGLADAGADVVVAGDPDQSILGFRGADPRGLLRFPDVFSRADGQPARIVVLDRMHRFGPRIAAAATGVLGQPTLAPLPASVQQAHRRPEPGSGVDGVQARRYPSEAAQVAGIAEVLLSAHAGFAGGPPLPWSDMAVLVRNPAAAAPLLRGLRHAGVPVHVPAGELPLADEPAVRVLTDVVSLAMGPRADGGAGRGATPSAGAMLAGPLGGLAPTTVRRLARELLSASRADPATDSDPDSDPEVEVDVGAGAAQVTGDQLLTALVTGEDPVPGWTPNTPHERAAVTRVTGAVAATREALSAGRPVAVALWAAWSATDWPDRIRDLALAGGAGSADADRDADAALLLFDMAGRLPPQSRGHSGMAAFLAELRGLHLPGEVRLPARAEPDGVSLLSVHRAKGLAWQLVIVAGVQEGRWPDLRVRADVLRTGELGARGRIDPRSHADLLAEERRLMYVACTRAKSALLVCAVSEPTEGGLQSSRFLPDLGVPISSEPEVASASMAPEALVTELRLAAAAPPSIGADGRPDRAVEELRSAALARLTTLARNAAAADPAGPLAGADPGRWWGVADLSGPAALAGSDAAPRRQAALSASAVVAIRTCPLRWFLDRQVGAARPSGPAAVVGTLVHRLAEAVGRAELPAEVGPVTAELDRAWPAWAFGADYQARAERERARGMVDALVAWHHGTGRRVGAVEARFDVEVVTDAGPVRLTGSIDRVDRGDDGSAHVVDFKTSRTAPSAADAAADPQLGVYQLAITAGALGAGDPPPQLGGAELVVLGDRFASGLPKVRRQAPLAGAPSWAHDVVAEAARLADGPRYPARPGRGCPTCAHRSMCPAGPDLPRLVT